MWDWCKAHHYHQTGREAQKWSKQTWDGPVTHLTWIWWRRSRTEELLHPRYWRPSERWRNESWALQTHTNTKTWLDSVLKSWRWGVYSSYSLFIRPGALVSLKLLKLQLSTGWFIIWRREWTCIYYNSFGVIMKKKNMIKWSMHLMQRLIYAATWA